MIRWLMAAAVAGLMGLGAASPAEEATSATLALARPGDTAEVAFLREMEARNVNTKALNAKFRQTRVDSMLGDRVVSDGEFWYQAPGLFRASYKGDKESGSEDSDIWMRDNKLITYTPALRQAEVIHQAAGDKAPVNQLLLGFGVQVERIQRLFDVKPAAKAREGLTGILFVSRDPDFSLGYDTITVYFDTARREPRMIVLEQEGQDITVELREVRVNPEIKPSVFETNWPKNVEVLEYKQL